MTEVNEDEKEPRIAALYEAAAGRDPALQNEVEQARATFLESWQVYRDQPSDPSVVATPSDVDLVSDSPMVELSRESSSPSRSSRADAEPYSVKVDCDGFMREKQDGRLEAVSIDAAAEKMGVTESDLTAAWNAASRGLFNAQPHADRAKELFVQQAERVPALRTMAERLQGRQELPPRAGLLPAEPTAGATLASRVAEARGAQKQATGPQPAAGDSPPPQSLREGTRGPSLRM